MVNPRHQTPHGQSVAKPHMLSVPYISRKIWVLFVSFITVQSCDMHKLLSALWPDGRIRLFAYYTTSSCGRFWTNKMIFRYILSSVCLRLSQFSQSSSMQHMGLYVFSLPISLMMIMKINVLYAIVIIKSEVWPSFHCLGSGHEKRYALNVFLYHFGSYWT